MFFKKSKKSSLYGRTWMYSYFPLETTKQIELRRTIRERLAR